MVPVIEAVPNFSEGRELDVVGGIVEAVAGEGAEVVDWSADPDHHRSVVTFLGDPETVENAAVAAARVALERIDLRRHSGVHPRIGALDVLPFVPLLGATMEEAVAVARRTGRRLAALGIPVYFYGEASSPPGRALAELRRGGFEALAAGFPPEREPDLLPEGWTHPGAHPTAGATCVGARPLLLAWNVSVEGIGIEEARAVARDLREAGGGFPGLRALALHLPGRDRIQISMNLEDVEARSPEAVFAALEERVAGLGGRVVETEVVGMIPDALVLTAAAARLRLRDPAPGRLLSRALARHVAGRSARSVAALLEAVERAGDAVPEGVRAAAGRAETLLGVPPFGDSSP